MKKISGSFATATLSLFVVFAVLLVGAAYVFAADTTFLSPTSSASNASGDDWATPNNAFASDNQYATETNGERERYLNFNLSVPAGSTVNGIEARVEAKSTDSSGCQLGVDLSWNGGTTFTGEKNLSLTNSDVTTTLGSTADNWGRSWSSTEFSNANFVARVRDIDPGSSCGDGFGNHTSSLDLLQVRVTYTLPTQPELTVSKSNSVGGSVAGGGAFNWTLVVTNSGTSAAFADSQTILSDSLPSTNVSYGSPVAVTGAGTTGTVTCSIVSNDLSCTASGGSVTLPTGGTITVTVPVTAGLAGGTLVNPRSGGACSVDPSSLVTESNESNNTCSNSVTVIGDSTRPTATMSYSQTPIKAGDSITIQADFSEAMIGSPAPQISIYGANTVATSTMTFVNATRYTFSYVVGAGNGTARVALGTGTDLAGNLIVSAPTNPTFTVDNTAPTLAVVTPVPTNTNDTTPNFTFSSSEGGILQYSGDCSAATGTANSGNNTITFNALAAGTHSNCTVKVTDGALNASALLAVPAFTIDTTVPTVTINQASGQVDPTESSPVTFTAVFSEPINAASFIASDLTLSPAGTTAIITAVDSVTYSISVSGMSVSGPVTATMAASRVTDLAGNQNTASTFTDNSVQYNLPQYTITVNQATGGTIAPGTGTFDQGTNHAYTITPSTGYIVLDVLADGDSVGALSSWSFNAITMVHDITALFDGGWKAPTSTSDSDNDVTNENNLLVSDNVYGTWDSSNDEADFLNFSLGIPAGATITGIDVAVEGSTTGRDPILSLSKNGGSSYTSTQTLDFTSTEETQVASGPSALWGTTWTANDFSNANFRVRIGAGSSNTLSIDQIQVKVSYTPDTTAPTGGSVTYTNGYFTTLSVPVTYTLGSDSAAGINNASGKIQRAVANLTGTTCDTFSAFTDLVTEFDGSYTDTSVTTGNCYMYQYLINDNAGNTATYTSANVAKIDTTAPVVTVDPYTTAPTNSDINVTASTNEGTLNATSHLFTANGSFTFTATDAAGNSSSQTVTITNIDKTAPVITVSGTAPVSVAYGVGYADQGATASDNADGNITAQIVKTGDTVTAASPVGTYHTYYNVSDSAGNAATQADRVINVTPASSVTTITCPANVTYTGTAQTPCTAQVTGVGGLDQSVTVDYTNNSAAGIANASATFAGDTNHTGSSDAKTFSIDQAGSVTVVTCPTTEEYTGAAIEPCTVSVTGAGGLNQTPAPQYSDNTVVGTASASYTFAGDDNHTGSNDSETFAITKAESTTVVTCPASVTFTGAAQTPCTAQVTGTGGLDQSVSVDYTSNTDAGTANASATFAGDANHNGSTDAKSFSIGKAASVTALSCPTNVTYTGTAQTPCTATVTGDGGLNESVTVDYTANTDAGTANASATFAGDSNHDGSSDAKTFSIDQAGSVTVVTCPTSVTYTGDTQTPCTVSVTGTGGLSLTPDADYSNNTNAGTATASYTFSGDSNHSGSSDSETFVIDQASSVTTVSCPTSQVYTGAAIEPCTANVTGSGGLDQTLTVVYSANTDVGTAGASASFAGDSNHSASTDSENFEIEKADSVTVVTCPASVVYNGSAQTPCTVSVMGAGGLSLAPDADYSANTNVGTASASYSYTGDANHAASSDTENFDISAAASITTVTCPVSVTYTGAPQTPCTANVVGDGGLNESVTVDYTDNTNAGTANASATFAGDANHSGSTDAKTFEISAATSVTTVTCPANVTFTGSAQTPCTVSVVGDGGLSLSPDADYSANTNAGLATASYTFAGDANHSGSTDTKNFTIDAASSVTTITCPVSETYTGAAIEPCTATVVGDGGLNESVTVTYEANIDVGTATANADFAGDSNHSASADSKTFAITAADSVTTVTCPASVVFTGAAQTQCTVSVTGTGGLSLTPAADYSANTNVGTASASYSYVGDANHSASSDSKTFEITAASSVTTVTCPASVVFTGAAQMPCTANVVGDGGLNESVTVDYTSNTAAGTANASATYVGDANHSGSTDAKTFEIAAATSVTTITCPVSVTYTGSAQTPCTATVTGDGGLNESVSVDYTANTDAGTANASATFAGDSNHSGSSDTETFAIGQATSATVVTCPASVVYNASAQTPCTVSVTGDGALSLTPDADYSANTNVGTASASYTFAGDANHSGSTDSKTFEITQGSGTVALTDLAQFYDGTPKAATITTTPTGLTVDVTYDGSATVPTAVGSYAVVATITDANYSGSANDTLVISDNVAPVVTVPANISVPATDASGAVASFTATAADDVDGAITPVCTPASGSTFAIGTTTVICTAEDVAHNGASAQFDIGVYDAGAPVISVQADMTVEATSATGATVNYTTPTATDDVDLSVTVSCTPVSGTVFGFGTTTVNCSATDTASNSSASHFDVGVVDTTAPLVTLNGQAVINLTIGDTYLEEGATSTDAVDGELPAVVGGDAVNTALIGTYIVSYSKTDAHGNAATPVTRTVNVADLPAPVISAESAGTFTTTSATITWTTDHPATSRVVYDTVTHPTLGIAPNYGYAFSTTEDPTLATSHTVTITGLTPNTQYFFRPVSHGSPEAVGNEVNGSTETEVPATQCSDGIDNDGDEATDYPADSGCVDAEDNDETNEVAPEVGTLNIQKVVVGGTKSASDFSFQLDGGIAQIFDVSGTNFVSVAVGTHSVNEVNPNTGNYLTTYGGDCNAQGTVSVGANETKTCVITNTYSEAPVPTKGTLKVVKVTHGDNNIFGLFSFGGDMGHFLILTFFGHGSKTFSNVDAGTYTITEAAKNGWTLTSNTCANVQVVAGQTSTCTIVNTKDAAPATGKLKVIKKTIGGNGKFTFSGDAGGFSITTHNGSGSKTVSHLTPGSYSVTENAKAGWTETSNTCDDVQVTANHTATCTIVNTKDGEGDGDPETPETGTIIIQKVTNPSGDASDFHFDASYDEDGFDLSDSEQNVAAGLAAGTYSVSESATEGWQSDGGLCTSSNESTETPDAINLSAGETVTCVFTNTSIAATTGTIVVKKVTVPAGDTTNFQFNASYDDNGFVLSGDDAGNTNVTAGLTPGTYSVSEGTLPEGWSQTSAVCDDGSNPASIGLSAGETVTCTFTNTKATSGGSGGNSGDSGNGGGSNSGSGGGGGGGNGPISGSLGGGGGPVGQVLGASTTNLPELPAGCTALLNSYMRFGKKNDASEVKKLQQFLNDKLSANLPITGFFGSMTDSAVKKFQSNHTEQILTPWGITDPTGYVYKTTQRWVNLMSCSSLNIPMPELN